MRSVRGFIGGCVLLSLTSGTVLALEATYHYDDAGRLTSIVYADDTSIVYTLDAAGNRIDHSDREVFEWLVSSRFAGNALIGELLADPAAFKKRVRAYQLLDEYFDGLPVDTLRPLLTHEDPLVQHAAVWVASELGEQVCAVLDEVIRIPEAGDAEPLARMYGVIAAKRLRKCHPDLLQVAASSSDGNVSRFAAEAS